MNNRKSKDEYYLNIAKAVLEEFRILARSMFHEVPDEFKYLLQDCVHQEVNRK